MNAHLVIFHSGSPQWEIGDPTYYPDGSLESAWVKNGNWFLKRREDGLLTSHAAPDGVPRGSFRVENFAVVAIECERDPIAAWFACKE